ncbi:MAG: thioredoxin fold domain-containing protein [Acidithiobacillus sp.]|nr:thioredoxin fold domain-containing protein [Acidithiobacillus sp.]
MLRKIIAASLLLAPLCAWAEVPLPAVHHIVMPKVPLIQHIQTPGELVASNPHAGREAHPTVVHQNPVVAPPSLYPLTANQKKLLEKVHGFFWGSTSAPEKAMVFIDPNCIWCHRFYNQVQGGVGDGAVRYLIVPVAILKKSSMPKAERLLQSVNPSMTFDRNEEEFNVAKESGGLSGKPFHGSKTLKKLVEINTAVLADMENGQPATPTFIVKTKNGLALHKGFIHG